MTKIGEIAISPVLDEQAVTVNRFTGYGNGSNSELCPPAHQTVKWYETFSKRLQKSSTYRKLREEHATELNALNYDALQEVLRRHLDDTDTARRHFEQRGKFRRISQKTIRFLSTFSCYIDAYGGIVEVMRARGGEYGETAYKTLSILLVVAVNKQKRDDRIGEVLEQLRKQYSRFKTLNEIHPTPEMKTLLAEAYKLGIDFARYATFYYLRSSVGRLWSVIVNPPSIFEETLTKIATGMESIKDQSAILDSIRLHRVDHTVGEVQRTIVEIDSRHTEVEKVIRGLQKSQWDTYLEKIYERILPNYQSVTEAVNDYQLRLNATFDSHRQDPVNRLPELQSSQAYQGWISTQNSSFLLIRGESMCLTHFCWFSPLVLRLSQEFNRSGEAVAFHCCQVMDSNEKGDRFISMLNHIVLQILEKMPYTLDLAFTNSIWKKIDSLQWGKEAGLVLDVLSEIFSNFEKVTLIIDRADLMRGDWEECLYQFCQLGNSKEAECCVVKIVLVASCISNDWRSLKARMINIVEEGQVFELYCSESDWQS